MAACEWMTDLANRVPTISADGVISQMTENDKRSTLAINEHISEWMLIGSKMWWNRVRETNAILVCLSVALFCWTRWNEHSYLWTAAQEACQSGAPQDNCRMMAPQIKKSRHQAHYVRHVNNWSITDNTNTLDQRWAVGTAYTDVARSAASKSSADPASMKWDTSAIETPIS